MQLSQLREQLLLQHASLRELVSEVAAQNARSQDEAGDEQLRRTLGKLSAALSEHNRFEETSLRGIIVKLDVWGPQRESLMDSRHHDEHRLALEALEQSFATKQRSERTERLAKLLDSILDHMKHEEREILHPNVLRDDVITADPFGG